MINSDLIHFTKAKKKAQLRIKDHLGTFVCNNREARKAAEQILEDYMKLSKSFSWTPYDPHVDLSLVGLYLRLFLESSTLVRHV